MGHDYMCKLDSLIDSFVCAFHCEVDSKGFERMSLSETNAVADIIKDLTEAKKNCESAEKNRQEARYYCLISKAMEESSGMHEYDISIHGKQRGHVSTWMRDHEVYEDDMRNRMGYTETASHSDMHSSADRYGKAYHDFMTSKHHYANSHMQSDKDSMEMHANEHMMDSTASIREVYKALDPDMRKKMKADLTKFVGDLPA